MLKAGGTAVYCTLEETRPWISLGNEGACHFRRDFPSGGLRFLFCFVLFLSKMGMALKDI